MTFAPTCKSNYELALDVAGDSSTSAQTTFDFTVTSPPGAPSAIPTLDGNIVLKPASPGANAGTGSITLSQLDLSTIADAQLVIRGLGAIAWTAYPLGGTKYRFIGSVTNPQTQAAIGYIILLAESNDGLTYTKFKGYMTDDIESKLASGGADNSYWDTVPGCDTATGAYLQSVVTNAANTAQNLTTQSRVTQFGAP